MSSHLKPALFRLSIAGAELERQPTGDDLCDLEKAKRLANWIYHFKETFGHACDELNVNPDTFVYLKERVNTIDEDGELAEVIEKLEEATDEPEDPREHSTLYHNIQGTTPFIRGR